MNLELFSYLYVNISKSSLGFHIHFPHKKQEPVALAVFANNQIDFEFFLKKGGQSGVTSDFPQKRKVKIQDFEAAGKEEGHRGRQSPKGLEERVLKDLAEGIGSLRDSDPPDAIKKGDCQILTVKDHF